jgi:hypothetical protein
MEHTINTLIESQCLASEWWGEREPSISVMVESILC